MHSISSDGIAYVEESVIDSVGSVRDRDRVDSFVVTVSSWDVDCEFFDRERVSEPVDEDVGLSDALREGDTVGVATDSDSEVERFAECDSVICETLIVSDVSPLVDAVALAVILDSVQLTVSDRLSFADSVGERYDSDAEVVLESSRVVVLGHEIVAEEVRSAEIDGEFCERDLD